MLLAQISDLHFLPHGTLAFGRVDVAGCLERAIDHLAALQPRPDAVLITGDLTNDGDADGLGGIDGRARTPRRAGLSAAGQSRRSRADARSVRASRPVPGAGAALLRGRARAAAPDRPGQPGPRRSGRPARCGAARLARCPAGEAPQTPTLVALHHPPFRTGIDHMDAMMLTDGAALAAVIGRHPQVERVLCGHVHRSGAMPLRRHHRPDRAGRRARRAAGARGRAGALDHGAAGHAAARMAGWARPGHPPRLHRRVRGRRVQRSAHAGAGALSGPRDSCPTGRSPSSHRPWRRAPARTTGRRGRNRPRSRARRGRRSRRRRAGTTASATGAVPSLPFPARGDRLRRLASARVAPQPSALSAIPRLVVKAAARRRSKAWYTMSGPIQPRAPSHHDAAQVADSAPVDGEHHADSSSAGTGSRTGSRPRAGRGVRRPDASATDGRCPHLVSRG